MMFRSYVACTTAILGVLAAAASSQAAIDLKITEIWMGGTAPTTEDWFELTNFGDTAWVSGVDPDLRVDDNSNSFANSQPVAGISSIGPRESAIILMEGGDAGDVAAYLSAWASAKPQNPALVGFAGTSGQGLGLGGGGDAVHVWLGATQIDSASYGSGSAGRSWDVLKNNWSIAGVNGAVLNGGTTAGPQSVPEPACVTLLALGLAGFAASRRHR